MLSTADIDQMKADLLEVRNDRSESITIRRGNTTLAAQTVRIERMGNASARRQDTGPIEQSEQRVVVLGAVDMNIQEEDRFNDSDGRLYEVDAIRPNRSVGTIAEARVID